jgi:ATP-dependent Clp protease ATP-binding subunit ClpC
MFERFTDRARRTVVLAQDEARGLQHNYIGTEHILLGLIGASEGVAARVLERYEMSLDAVREEVKARVGTGSAPVTGRIPFTPRGKKCLELSLREALQLNHNYIGTEHLLLGLIRESDGEGAQIIRAHAGDLLRVRMAVLDLVPSGRADRGARWRRRLAAARPLTSVDELSPQPGMAQPRLLQGEGDEPRTTPAAEHSLDGALRLAAGQAVGSHHLLLAALDDPDTVVARTLAGLGVDLEQAKQALRQADVTGTSDEQPEDAGRRQMRIRVSEDQLTIEASDPAIVGLGRAAVGALANGPSGPGIIAGDQPATASLSYLWLALKDTLEDIRTRAVAIAATGAGSAGTESADTKTTGAESTDTKTTGAESTGAETTGAESTGAETTGESQPAEPKTGTDDD